jgi:hypothetical protein
MKLVREYINEKFTQESDPIRDLNIGGFSFEDELRKLMNKFNPTKEKKTWEKILTSSAVKKYWLSLLDKWFLGKRATGLFAKGNANSHDVYRKQTTGKVIKIKSFFDQDGDPYNFELLGFALICSESRTQKLPDYWPNKDEVWYYFEPYEMFKQELSVNEKIFVESINEKFTLEGDPIHQMGIGIQHVREFDTFKEAAEIYVNNINVLSRGVFKSREDLRQYLKDSEEGLITSIRSLLKACKEYLEGFRELPGLVIKEFSEMPFTLLNEKIQCLKDFRNAVIAEAKKTLIHEKFTEKSDPVHDMGIGVDRIVHEFKKELDELLPSASIEKIFNYYKKEKFIRIRVWGLSSETVNQLEYVLKKLCAKYEGLFHITQQPLLGINRYGLVVHKDAIIRIR